MIEYNNECILSLHQILLTPGYGTWTPECMVAHPQEWRLFWGSFII